ncbi:unnamed protein product [Closterium sp. NIES-65]|nr:unnamed protein product [Closterium sp. NIES-65]CAI6009329.1 unnamed protein product [Closterium sp. NIES-65]
MPSHRRPCPHPPPPSGTPRVHGRRFYEAARAAVEGVLQGGGVPMAVGGTGLYLAWLLCGLLATPPSCPSCPTLERAMAAKIHATVMRARQARAARGDERSIVAGGGVDEAAGGREGDAEEGVMEGQALVGDSGQEWWKDNGGGVSRIQQARDSEPLKIARTTIPSFPLYLFFTPLHLDDNFPSFPHHALFISASVSLCLSPSLRPQVGRDKRSPPLHLPLTIAFAYTTQCHAPFSTPRHPFVLMPPSLAFLCMPHRPAPSLVLSPPVWRASGLLEESLALLRAGLQPDCSSPTRVIGYRQAMSFLLHCQRLMDCTRVHLLNRFLPPHEELVRMVLRDFDGPTGGEGHVGGEGHADVEGRFGAESEGGLGGVGGGGGSAGACEKLCMGGAPCRAGRSGQPSMQLTVLPCLPNVDFTGSTATSMPSLPRWRGFEPMSRRTNKAHTASKAMLLLQVCSLQRHEKPHHSLL